MTGLSQSISVVDDVHQLNLMFHEKENQMKRIRIAALSFCLGLLSLPFVQRAHADEWTENKCHLQRTG